MKTNKIIAQRLAVMAMALGVVGCAMSSGEKVAPVPAAPVAAAPSVTGTVSEGLVSATATVKAIDQKTRRVTLQRADGSVFKFVAGDEVRNLPQVKVGDEVTVSYYESLAYEVKKPGEAAVGAAVGEATQRAEVGEKPGAAAVRTSTITATITAIDRTARTVTLQGPDGEATTIKARDPEKLDRVAVGDLVEITYTEALAISVDPPQKK